MRMIGHLSARMIGARPPIDLDLDAIFAAAEETGTALEINGGLPRLDMSVEALRARAIVGGHVRPHERCPRSRGARSSPLRRAERRAGVGPRPSRRERLARRSPARMDRTQRLCRPLNSSDGLCRAPKRARVPTTR